MTHYTVSYIMKNQKFHNWVGAWIGLASNVFTILTFAQVRPPMWELNYMIWALRKKAG